MANNQKKPVTANTKKAQEKKYQNKLKNEVNGFLVTSEKSKPESTQVPVPASQPLKKEKKVISKLSSDLKAIREAILNELKRKEELPEKPKFRFKKVKKEQPKEKVSGKKEKVSFYSQKKLKKITHKAFFPKTKKMSIIKKKEGKELININKEKVAKKAKGINNHQFLKTVVVSIVILIVIFISGIYLGGWRGSIVNKVAKIIPFPALYVDGNMVKAYTFLNDLDALEKYMERLAVPASQSQLKKQVIQSLIEKNVIYNIAQEKGISLSDQEINEMIDFLKVEEGEEVEELIKQLYDWNIEEYTQNVLAPLLLAQKVEEDFNNSDIMSYLEADMAGYLNKLEISPEKFAEIASGVNDDNTKFVGGDLGWFSLGDMVPEFELAILDMEEGRISQIIETRFGLHIIKLEERVISPDGQTTFKASHIFRQTPSFKDYLDQQIKKAKVLTLIKI